jgi:hypothetical protein
VNHHQIAALLFAAAAIAMLIEWVLRLAGRATAHLDVLAWTAMLAGFGFVVR